MIFRGHPGVRALLLCAPPQTPSSVLSPSGRQLYLDGLSVVVIDISFDKVVDAVVFLAKLGRNIVLTSDTTQLNTGEGRARTNSRRVEGRLCRSANDSHLQEWRLR